MKPDYLPATKEEAAAIEAFTKAFAALPKDVRLSIDDGEAVLWRRDRAAEKKNPGLAIRVRCGPKIKAKPSQLDSF